MALADRPDVMAFAHDEDAPPKLIARTARSDELDAFLAIARRCVEETGGGKPFDEQAARYAFAGLARADPAIGLLFAGTEIIGFSLVTIRATFLTGDSVGREDLVFIRADRYSPEGELRLHAYAHEWFEYMKLTEAYLLVPPSEHAEQVYATLIRELGYRAAGARLRSADAATASPFHMH